MIPEKCPVFQFPLAINFGGKAPAYNSPSLDRIVPELGYVPGNVLVISYRANTIKHNATPDEILTVGNFFKKLEMERAT